MFYKTWMRATSLEDNISRASRIFIQLLAAKIYKASKVSKVY